jgi:hypothetical protein
MLNGFQFLWGLLMTVRGFGIDPPTTSGLECRELLSRQIRASVQLTIYAACKPLAIADKITTSTIELDTRVTR